MFHHVQSPGDEEKRIDAEIKGGDWAYWVQIGPRLGERRRLEASGSACLRCRNFPSRLKLIRPAMKGGVNVQDCHETRRTTASQRLQWSSLGRYVALLSSASYLVTTVIPSTSPSPFFVLSSDTTTMAPKLTSNRAVKMLDAAAEGKYGVLGVVSYNLETIVACIRAAEAKSSPIQILLFPWALKYSPLFVDLAAHAARSAKVPVTIHMDHAQDPEIIKQASQIKAADGTPAFDSIMVDMSHYEKEENLAKTKELVALCHERGIATEAEPGRIEGGEDGVKDTAELEGMMTTPEEVDDFIATGIDFLAPAFGNIHGEYGGVENIRLDYDR